MNVKNIRQEFCTEPPLHLFLLLAGWSRDRATSSTNCAECPNLPLLYHCSRGPTQHRHRTHDAALFRVRRISHPSCRRSVHRVSSSEEEETEASRSVKRKKATETRKAMGVDGSDSNSSSNSDSE